MPLNTNTLKTSEFSLVQLDKIKETLGNAATMGESELLDTSDKYADDLRAKLKASFSIEQANAAFMKGATQRF